jgi:hypothetical protein
MKKAIVTIIKRMILEGIVENKILNELMIETYSSVEDTANVVGINHYNFDVAKRFPNFKEQIDRSAKNASLNALYKLQGYIPELWDVSNRINLKMSLSQGQIPDVPVEVLTFIRDERDKFKLAINFETESFILLDALADKLLLGIPSDAAQDDDTQTFFADTFFLKLNDDMYFGDYKVLDQTS